MSILVNILQVDFASAGRQFRLERLALQHSPCGEQSHSGRHITFSVPVHQTEKLVTDRSYRGYTINQPHRQFEKLGWTRVIQGIHNRPTKQATQEVRLNSGHRGYTINQPNRQFRKLVTVQVIQRIHNKPTKCATQEVSKKKKDQIQLSFDLWQIMNLRTLYSPFS